MSRGETRRRLVQALAGLCVVIAAAPLFFGDGVDVPDDALYSTVSTWEAIRYAVRHGLSPFFLPGKLGGVSVYAEAIHMGPLYPGMWLAFVLPMQVAFPLAFALHCLGSMLAVRWLARVYGVSAAPALVAGVAVAAGPVGLAAFIECQADFWPVLLWFPLVLGSMERCRQQSERRSRLRWAARAGLCLGLLLLGSHVRLSAATCGALGVFLLLQGPRMWGWASLATLLGLALGAPSFVPAILELQEARGADGSTVSMAVPPFQPLRWGALASWLTPRTLVTAREFSVGTVLAATFVVGLPLLRGPLLRLALLVPILLLAASSLPVLRVALLPLTWLAHPTVIAYYAVAMVPAAVVGAAGLERLLASRKGGTGRTVALGVLATLVGLSLLRLLLALLGWASPQEATVLAVATAQGLVVLVALGLVWKRVRSPASRAGWLMAIALLDLAAIGVRYHVAVPARPLELGHRQQKVEGEELIAGGYLHIGEMAALMEDGWDRVTPFQEGLGGDVVGGEVQELWEEAPTIQDDLLDRRWPVHLGAARGVRSLSARVKLPPMRQVEALLPLAEALAPEGWDSADGPYPWDQQGLDPAELERLFGDPKGLGARTLALHGVGAAVDEAGVVFEVEAVAPRCYSPGRFEVVQELDARIARLLSRSFEPTGPALLEGSLPEPRATGVAEVACDADGLRVQVRSTEPALVVLRERYHPGWQVTDLSTGERLQTIPVNQVHTGVTVPTGQRELRWRFVPPGLPLGACLALLALLLCGLTGLPDRR
jgi:hypothetical protein